MCSLEQQASNGRTAPRSSAEPPRPRAPRRARTKCNQYATESGVGWRRAFRAFRLQQLQKHEMDMVYADAALGGTSSLIVDNPENTQQQQLLLLLLLLQPTTPAAGYDMIKKEKGICGGNHGRSGFLSYIYRGVFRVLFLLMICFPPFVISRLASDRGKRMKDFGYSS